jgi:hypothetical protein
MPTGSRGTTRAKMRTNKAPPRQDALKRVGRPKGPDSTIINMRIPLELLSRLDRYVDHLEEQTGLKANRGMIARRALALFLETHETA